MDTEIDWEDIILQLHAFVRSITRHGIWSRGKTTTTYLAGKEVDDYVYEAIGRYLEHREKFDPGKGSLIDYLKHNIAQSLVSNDVRLAENHLTTHFSAVNKNSDEDDEKLSYQDRLLPAVKPMFSDHYDYQEIKTFIEDQIKGDSIAEMIFLGHYIENLKREKVMKEFDISEKDYANGIRRVKTAISRAIAVFNTNNQKHGQEKRTGQV